MGVEISSVINTSRNSSTNSSSSKGYKKSVITSPDELATLKPQQKVAVKSAANYSFNEVTIIEGSFGDKFYKDSNRKRGPS